MAIVFIVCVKVKYMATAYVPPMYRIHIVIAAIRENSAGLCSLFAPYF